MGNDHLITAFVKDSLEVLLWTLMFPEICESAVLYSIIFIIFDYLFGPLGSSKHTGTLTHLLTHLLLLFHVSFLILFFLLPLSSFPRLLSL